MSMTTLEAEMQIGRVVGYKPIGARAQHGVITKVGKYGAHVLFVGDRNAKLCYVEHLSSIPEAWARTHHRDALDHYTVVMAEREAEKV
jgi:hypothetical protein